MLVEESRNQIKCNFRGCERLARRKLAARWTAGQHSELKNYGVYCIEHSLDALWDARQRRDRVPARAGESVGPVVIYRFENGSLDSELIPLPEPS